MSTIELLQELEEAIRELKPLLRKEDDAGSYLHHDITVHATPEQLRQLIDDVKKHNNTTGAQADTL
jgi:hypothetical protein